MTGKKPEDVLKALNQFNLQSKMRDLNILILSDLHFKGSINENKEQKRDRLKVQANLINSFKKRKTDYKIDIILVVGDLANLCNIDGYETFNELIKQLRELPCFSHAICFTCPGNHDINRKYDAKRPIKDYKLALMDLLSTVKVDRLWESYTEEALTDMIYSAIKSVQNDPKKLPEFLKNLKAHEKSLFFNYLEALDKSSECIRDCFAIKIPELEGLRTVGFSRFLGIDLLTVNSAWFCGLFKRDKEKLFLMAPVINILKTAKEESSVPSRELNNISLTMMHHPHSWLNEVEFNAVSSELDQAFTTLSALTNIFVSGHEHGEFKKPHSFDNRSHLIVNGCSFTNDMTPDSKFWPSTFGILTVKKISRQFMLQRYKLDKNNSYSWKPQQQDLKKTFDLLAPDRVNWDIDKELFYQLYECIRYIKIFILNALSPEEDIDRKEVLLKKQLKDLYDCDVALSSADRNIYYGMNRHNELYILVPFNSCVEVSSFDAEALVQQYKAGTKWNKITIFVYLDNVDEKEMFLQYDNFKTWTKNISNHYSQYRPLLFFNKLFIC